MTAPPGSLDHLAARRVAPTDRPLVVVHYGDSHSKGGVLALTLRDKLAAGHPVSPGHLAPGHPMRWGSALRKFGKWTRHNWLYGKDKGPFGPMGLAYSTESPRARMRLTLDRPAAPGTLLTVLYARTPEHLPFEIKSGRLTLARSPEPDGADALGILIAELPEGASNAELGVACKNCPKGVRLKIFGAIVQTPGARVAWDNLGIGGTTIIGPHKRSDPTLDAYLQWRAPDLLFIWYGANSSPEPDLVISDYKRRYREMILRMRKAAPQASCLLVGPPDLARWPDRSCFMTREERRLRRKRNKTREERRIVNKNRKVRACNPDRLITRKPGGGFDYPSPTARNRTQWDVYKETCAPKTPPNLPEIVRVQREVAEEIGCAYFDPYEDMGGEGAIMDWVCGDPQLAASDLIHLTSEGYRKVAEALWRDLQAVTSETDGALEP